MSKLQLYAIIMFLMSYDHTEIWTLQRWKESLNWGWKNWILTRELGRRKSPMFSSVPSRVPLATLRTFSALKVVRPFGTHNKLCLRGRPWRLRGGIPAYLLRQPVGRAVPSTGVFIWWHRVGGAGNVLPETLRFEEFWVLWKRRTVFPRSMPPNCVWIDSLFYKRPGWCAADGHWGHSLSSSRLPTHQTPWWSLFKEQEASLKF